MLTGRRIVLGVTGGIAAYKAAELCRLFVKAGAEVQVVMTEAAEAFISPLTMQALSGRKVGRKLVDLTEESEIGHISIADRAELIVIAPATADAIARMAAGLAGDLLTAVVLATRAPLMLAPAMNVNMWEHPLTQANLRRLIETGRYTTLGPDRGDLACGWIGAGRLVDPEVIFDAAAAALNSDTALAGRRVVVTAGPTHEAVDDVRFLGNRSSGKMGFAIAEAAGRMGADVTLIAGPVSLETPSSVSRRVNVESALEMRAAVTATLKDSDVLVMAAAVADFRPARRQPGKLSRRDGPGDLALVANPDILAEIGRARTGPRPWLIGFAAETAHGDGQALLERARAKRVEKGCDAIIANDVSQPGMGFGADDNEITVVLADRTVPLGRGSKADLARVLWRALLPLLPSRPTG
jgi:phosphopantothenoylcysteine decarboxylase/phosphopantothenate--cysteine ligase